MQPGGVCCFIKSNMTVAAQGNIRQCFSSLWNRGLHTLLGGTIYLTGDNPCKLFMVCRGAISSFETIRVPARPNSKKYPNDQNADSVFSKVPDTMQKPEIIHLQPKFALAAPVQ